MYCGITLVFRAVVVSRADSLPRRTANVSMHFCAAASDVVSSRASDLLEFDKLLEQCGDQWFHHHHHHHHPLHL